MELNPLFKFKSNFTFVCVLLTLVMIVVKSSPIVFESDMIAGNNIKVLKSLSVSGETDHSPRTKRGATAYKNKLWDFGVIPYVIDESVGFDVRQKARFREAMNVWEISTACACCTVVGKVGNVGQDVSIGEGCHTKSIILHELGHAIGFHHEHQRPDRDAYVRIQTHYIKSGLEHNYDKLKTEKVDSLGEPYDFASIMHYGPKDFGRGPTIEAKLGAIRKNGQMPTLNDPKVLSSIDIRQTNKLYNCPKCGGTIHDQIGSIISSDYHANSGEALRCEWLISVPRGKRIFLSLKSNINRSTNCEKSYIEVRDGYWHKSPLVSHISSMGNQRIFVSSDNHMTINFVRNKGDNSEFVIEYVAHPNEPIRLH